MTFMLLSDIQELKDRISRREMTLPGYWGCESDGCVAFQTAIDDVISAKRDSSKQETLKVLMSILSGFVRITNHTLETCKKKPDKAFVDFNVMCLVYVERLRAGETHETAVQTAMRKAHTVVENARKDKSHWLRKTNVWKRLLDTKS